MNANDARPDAPKAIVGVCTCRNPDGLRKLVEELQASIRRHAPARLIVVDNDERGEGLQLIRSLEERLAFPVTAVAEPMSGIPYARNRVIREALAEGFDYLLMLDDDEFPGEGWLDAMLGKAMGTGAAVVGGPVAPSFAAPLPPPLIESDYYHPGGRRTRRGLLVEITGNLLLSRSVVEGLRENWFSPRFAGGGGEDNEFLRRTAAAGYLHAMAPDAVVYETIPAERADPAWQILRSYSQGNVAARVRFATHGYLKSLAIELINIAGLGVAALLELLRGRFDARSRLQARIRLARAAGKMVAFAGVNYREYVPERYRRRPS